MVNSCMPKMLALAIIGYGYQKIWLRPSINHEMSCWPAKTSLCEKCISQKEVLTGWRAGWFRQTCAQEVDVDVSNRRLFHFCNLKNLDGEPTDILLMRYVDQVGGRNS